MGLPQEMRRRATFKFLRTLSYQIPDDDDNSVDNIRAEKQEDGRTQYFIYATVRVKMARVNDVLIC